MSEKPVTVAEMASMGGFARAKAHSKAELRKWGKRGGRRAKLRRKLSQFRRLLAAGRSHTECASVLGVSVRTVSRAVARMKRGENEHHLRGSIVLAISACSKAGTAVFFDDLYYIPV